MKILHVITKLNEMYGAQRHAVESVRNHLLNGHECVVIAGEIGTASSMVSELGVVVKQVKSLKNTYNIFTGIKAVSATRAIIRSFNPDLVISHSTIAGIIARVSCYKEKVPNIFTVQGWPFEIGAKWYQRLAGLTMEWLLKPVSDSYLCVSNYTASYGIKALRFKNKRRIYVCGNMHMDKDYTVPASYAVHKNVLMVAGFRGQKDHISALKALEIIIEQNRIPGFKMTFVGDGPRRGVIESYIRDHKLENHIELTGETKDVDKYYNLCDFVILPTFYEGLPLSLIEAIQKGKPIIATDVGGNNEIVEDGVNGNLIRVQDYKALANYIVDYYNSDRIAQYSVMARKIYESRYSYENVSAKLNAIIADVIEQSVYGRNKTNY